MATEDKVEGPIFKVKPAEKNGSSLEVFSSISNTVQHDGVPVTSREIWSYYAYYAASNGIGSCQ